MVYLITYDINAVVKNYDDLYAAIKSISGDYQHPLESTWFVATDMSRKQVYDSLRSHINDSDHLFVMRMTNDYYGWLSKNVWEWLNAHNL